MPTFIQAFDEVGTCSEDADVKRGGDLISSEKICLGYDLHSALTMISCLHVSSRAFQ